MTGRENDMTGRENDLRIETEKVILKSRACGLAYYDEKYLFVNMGASHWCLPGGHIELNEDSKSASMREMQEETGMEVDAGNLFLLNENFFFNKYLNKNFHEIAFYYLVSPKGGTEIIKDQIRMENDKGVMKKLGFKWFTKEELENIEVKPDIVKKLILTGEVNKFNHIIFRD